MRPLPTIAQVPAPPPPERVETSPGRSLELGAPAPAANQRRGACPTQRAYPWLLAASTVLAGVFCALYLSKPVIVAADLGPPANLPSGEKQVFAATSPLAAELPSSDQLPGDSGARPRATEPQKITSASASAFEETNVRIQHVLSAQGPAGEDLGRIILDVPVLYQSASLRWTPDDVDRARSLLSRIQTYQQHSATLRQEAVALLSEWDDLVVLSIPDASLRADSPTLPENQGVGAAGDSALNTTESIQIQNR